MESMLPLLFALGIGFSHAFEADHLIAISNIVTRRTRSRLAMQDGIFWGLGHTTTILIVGLIVMLGKLAVNESIFGYLEGLVGILLIGLGLVRLLRLLKSKKAPRPSDQSGHKVAYGVGLIHGLAGSGAVVLIALSEVKGVLTELFYLLSFGFGSIAGMLIAAGLFCLPFSKKFAAVKTVRQAMVIISSLLCIGYGGLILSNLVSWGFNTSF